MRLFLVVLLAALVSAAPAHAGPIGAAITAIGGFLKATIAAGGIGAALLRLGASVALSLLAQRLAPKPKAPGMRIGGVGTGEDFPRATVLGRYIAPASLVYHNSWGTADRTPNAYYVAVYALDDRPGASLNRVAMGDQWVTLGATAHPDFGRPVIEFRDQNGNRDNAWVKFYDGTQLAADPYLVARFGSDPQFPWTTAAVGRGVCYAIVTTILVRRKVFPNGQPAVRFELDGAGLYDPRRDSTAGGDGPQRAATPATWEPTRNLAILAAAVARGVPLPGGRVWGGGVDVPVAVIAAAANVCDTTVGSPARPRFRGGLQVALPEAEPAATVEALVSAGLGWVANTGIDLRFGFGAPELPIVSITDDDAVITEARTEVPFPSLRETVNALRISHPDPARLYETVHTAEKIDPAALAEDGRYLPVREQLVALTDHDQAQDVRDGMLADARRFRRFTLALPPDILLQLRPGATLSWTSARYGFAAKLFEVAEVETDLATLFGFAVLREREPGDVAPPDVTLPLPLVPVPVVLPPRVFSAFAAAPHIVTDAAAAPRAPAIRVTWDADRVEDARQVVFRWRLVAGGAQVGALVADATAGEAILAAGVTPGTGYLVEALPVLDRPADWSPPVAVTAPDVRLDADGLGDDLRGLIDTLDDWIEGGTGNLPVRLDGQDGAITNLDTRLTNAEGVNTAQATAITSLTATVTQHGNTLTAHAGYLVSLSAATGGDPAQANFRMEAVSGPSGFAQIGFQTRTGGAGAWRSAGLFIQTPTDPALPSRIVATADQFLFTTPGGVLAPFVVSGSELRVSVPIQSAGYVAGVSGFRLDPVTGDIDAGSLTVRRGNILRGSLSATFFLQTSSPFNGVATFGTWTSIGNQEFTVPAAATDVPDRIVIRPAIGGKLPFFNNSASQSSLTLGALYRFRLLLRRGGVTVETTAWGEAPFWQFNWQNTIGTSSLTYGCVPSEVTFWVDTDELGVEPGDTIRVEYEYRRDRVSVPNANATPGFGVEHLTLEARVEYFYR